jgi:hypothetical protein
VIEVVFEDVGKYDLMSFRRLPGSWQCDCRVQQYQRTRRSLAPEVPVHRQSRVAGLVGDETIWYRATRMDGTSPLYMRDQVGRSNEDLKNGRRGITCKGEQSQRQEVTNKAWGPTLMTNLNYLRYPCCEIIRNKPKTHAPLINDTNPSISQVPPSIRCATFTGQCGKAQQPPCQHRPS